MLMPERERLGREDGLDQPLGEQLLGDLLEPRQHAGMVGGDPALEPVEPFPVAEHPQIGVREVGRAVAGMRADPRALVRGRQPQARPTGTAATAASQPARLKMKVIAGSSPSRSRISMTSGRDGTQMRRGRGDDRAAGCRAVRCCGCAARRRLARAGTRVIGPRLLGA